MTQNQLLSRVARNIRYRPLPHLIGLDVKVTSLETTVATVERNVVRDAAGMEATVSPSVNLLSIVKYGLLDLTFEVRQITWGTEDKQGPRLLRECGFIVEPEDQPSQKEALLEQDNDPTCLKELDADIERGTSALLLFLEEQPGRDMKEHALRLVRNGKSMETFAEEFLATYFPKSFVVTDACLTNAPFVWFHKHFWL